LSARTTTWSVHESAVFSENALATETTAVPPATTSFVDGVSGGTGTDDAFTPRP
jgi:hypothetical protein